MAFPLDLYDWIKQGRLDVRLRGSPMSPPHQRFWAQLDKDGPIHPVWGQCWQWTGSYKGKGYGTIRVNNEALLAHRYCWVLHNGAIPDNLLVCHHCDNPGCVNPTHLFLGTVQDNAVDMTDKGRHVYSKGESNPNRTLTEEQVLEIRRRHPGRKDKTHGTLALAREFGVHPSIIRRIAYGKIWTHI